jgi:flagellar biosynthesis protein FliR
MFRTGGLMMTVPVFGHVTIPRIMRVWFVILTALMILPSSIMADIQPPSTVLHLMLVILSEIAVGILMGFAVIIVFSAVQFAGHIIGLQMGLAVANIIDPMGAGQISIIGEFYYLLSLLIFLLINGHHFLIEALAQCFKLVPLGAAVFGPNIEELFINLTLMMFVSGIKFAAPVIITLFIMNSVLGIVARTVPQMNVFVVGFPLAIGAGLALIGLSFPFFASALNNAFNGLERDIILLIRMFQG